MNPYTIRRANADDLKHVEALQMRFRKSDGMPVLSLDGNSWWLVWHRRKPVAYTGVRVLGEAAWITACGVVPQHRGHGLQRRMTRAACRFAKRLQCSVLYTHTVNGNPYSVNNLIAVGFRNCIPPREHYGYCYGKRDVLYWMIEP